MFLSKLAKECLSNQTKYAHLNAFISISEAPEAASRPSSAADTPNVTPNDAPLSAQFIAIKDNICTADVRTTAASGILKGFTSPYDATVVKQLLSAGATIAGKTNMDEFGMGSHSTHTQFGAVQQEGGLSAGGSSGGSAVAVATGQCTAALGTDTGGSVRLPAAYTSTIGFKPSYGLLSRWGVIAYANSLDTVGIFANDIATTRTLFRQLNKYDAQDPTSLPPSTRSRLGHRKRGRPLRIGIPLEYNISTLSPSVKQTWIHALHLLSTSPSAPATLHPVSLPSTRHALSAYYVLAPAEASSNLAKYDGVRFGSRAAGIDGTPDSVLFAKTRGAGFGDEVKRRILLGAFSLSADAIDNYFIQAQKVRRLVQRDFDAVFETTNPLLSSGEDGVGLENGDTGVDVIICPTAPTLPPTLSELKDQDPVDAYMNDVFTVPASLAGLPAISVPVDIPGKNSLSRSAGIQIIGQYGDDEVVLDVAEMLARKMGEV